MMVMLGMKERFTGVVAFTSIALPIYLVGCLGLRVFGVPAILSTIFRPDPKSGLRLVLAFFVVIGLLIALTCSITPRYHTSGWFLAQSKYVAWIFAVEVLQTSYRHLVARCVRPALAAAGITATAVALSVPAAAQHFSVGRVFQTYSVETLNVIDFLTKDAQPGDVVLPGDNLLAPTLALTKCQVPLGYFSNAMLARRDYSQRQTAEKEFWVVSQFEICGVFSRKERVRACRRWLGACTRWKR
jgi:hypothetical protein